MLADDLAFIDLLAGAVTNSLPRSCKLSRAKGVCPAGFRRNHHAVERGQGCCRVIG